MTTGDVVKFCQKYDNLFIECIDNKVSTTLNFIHPVDNYKWISENPKLSTDFFQGKVEKEFQSHELCIIICAYSKTHLDLKVVVLI